MKYNCLRYQFVPVSRLCGVGEYLIVYFDACLSHKNLLFQVQVFKELIAICTLQYADWSCFYFIFGLLVLGTSIKNVIRPTTFNVDH
jgi:hypothetical protein